jgi:hypothetical protein
MHEQRIARLVRALLLVAVGVQGLTSPLAKYALARAMPDCVDASPLTAWAGTETHMLMASGDCLHGSYAPTRSYFAVVQAAFACSLTALVFGLAALLLAVGLGIQTRRMLGSVRRWFAHPFTAAPARPGPGVGTPLPRDEPPAASSWSAVLLLLRTLPTAGSRRARAPIQDQRHKDIRHGAEEQQAEEQQGARILQRNEERTEEQPLHDRESA